MLSGLAKKRPTAADVRRARKVGHDITKRMLCSETTKAARHRYGARLPDDEGGRAMLKAMVAVGLYHARRWAPWVTDRELNDITDLVDAAPKGYWNGARLGRLIKLTYEERELLGIRLLHPYDVSWDYVQRKVKDREAEAVRQKRLERKMKMETAVFDKHARRESLLALLKAVGNELTVKQCAAKLDGGRAWRAPDGAFIHEASMVAIVRRVINELIEEGALRVRTKRHRNGKMMRLVGLKTVKTGSKIDKNTRTANVGHREHATNADEIRASDANKGVAHRAKKRVGHIDLRSIDLGSRRIDTEREDCPTTQAHSQKGHSLDEQEAAVRTARLLQRLSIDLTNGEDGNED